MAHRLAPEAAVPPAPLSQVMDHRKPPDKPELQAVSSRKLDYVLSLPFNNFPTSTILPAQRPWYFINRKELPQNGFVFLNPKFGLTTRPRDASKRLAPVYPVRWFRFFKSQVRHSRLVHAVRQAPPRCPGTRLLNGCWVRFSIRMFRPHHTAAICVKLFATPAATRRASRIALASFFRITMSALLSLTKIHFTLCPDD
jgi:hypothetical protein